MNTTSTNILSVARASWHDYLDLTQPRLIMLYLVSMLVALLIAGDKMPALPTLLLTLAGGYMAAGGAAALNSYLDRDLDAKMSRTRNRPLPAGRIEPENALRFGLALSVLSFFVLWIAANFWAAALAALGILMHVFVYTRWLKRKTVHSTVIGGIAGAVAPLVGWVAATGSLSMHAFVMAAMIFYWTPIYHWSLALMRMTDYSRASLPTLPVIKGGLFTRKHIVLYTVMMFFLTLLPSALGLLNFLYAEVALLAGGVFMLQTLQLIKSPGIQVFWRVHKYSQVYLVLLFAAMLVDKLIA